MNKIKFGNKILGLTEEGMKREAELMKDLCIKCLFRGVDRFCRTKKEYMLPCVISCGEFANTKLDTYLKQEKGKCVACGEIHILDNEGFCDLCNYGDW